MKLYLLLFLFFLIGCSSVEKKEKLIPTAPTIKVIESLNEVKIELEDAGKENTKVAVNIDKALTLAERLNALLETIEREQKKLQDKIVLKPINP
jgi:hypothetical protein